MEKIWRTETDIEGVKALSLSLLDTDIKLTKHSPLVISHPFADSGIVGIRGEDGGIRIINLVDGSAAIEEWREQARQQIREAETVLQLFMMVTKPYRLGYLKYAAPSLSEHDAAKLLSWVWTSSEAPNKDPNLSKAELLGMFRSIDPAKLMDEEEYERFQSLNDVVTVYRGVTPYNAKNVKALSWTLNRETAEWFAHRYGERGTVYEAQVKKEYIHALFLGRNETEVIVEPKYLMCLKQTQTLHQAETLEEPVQDTFPDGWRKGDTCFLITNKAKRYALAHTVESFDGTYFGVRGNTGLFHHVSPCRMFHTKEDAIASLEAPEPASTLKLNLNMTMGGI